MGLRIISVKGVKGRNVWDIGKLSSIKDDIIKNIKENGFAIVGRSTLIDAYRGSASGRNISINAYRKLKELVEEVSQELNEELSLIYYKEVIVEDEKTHKKTKFTDVYVIQ